MGEPGYATDTSHLRQLRRIQRTSAFRIELGHGVKKRRPLANGGFVFGNAIDVGNGAAHRRGHAAGGNIA
jgi:hypothetical protein